MSFLEDFVGTKPATIEFSATMADGVTTFPFHGEIGASATVDHTSYQNMPMGASSVVDTETPYTPNNDAIYAIDRTNGITYVLHDGTSFYSYGITANSWTSLTSPTVSLSAFRNTEGIVYNGKIYFVGYYDLGLVAYVNDKVRIYDIALDSWSELTFASGAFATGTLRIPTHDGAGNIYVVNSNGFTVDKYIIATNTLVSLTAQTATAGFGDCPIYIKDGFIYFIGHTTYKLFKYNISTAETTFVTTFSPGMGNQTATGAFLLYGNDKLLRKATNTSYAEVYNLTTKILQEARYGLGYGSLQTNGTYQNVNEYNGALYTISPYNSKFDASLGAYPPYVIKVDLSVPHFYNLKKEV